MTKISAVIDTDSKNQFGNRLTTFVLTFPRYILAEFNTHRMLSKNSASSRAIPFEKMLASVKENPFIPLAWMKDHKGMQGSDYITSPVSVQRRIDQWLWARDLAVLAAEKLHEPLNSVYNKNEYPFMCEDQEPLTKQLVNRILEPYMWHTVITTGTEFQNFFKLRASEFADIHIQELAYQMLAAYNNSTPKTLKAGEWHIPFGDKMEGLKALATEEDIKDGTYERLKLKVAIARCARVSYTVVGEEGKPDNYENDIKLYDRLLSSGHFSPFEHLGRAMDDIEYRMNTVQQHTMYNGDGHSIFSKDEGWSGNFKGFIQYRKMLLNENQTDDRVLVK